ncbi:DNA-binding PadR family transcriptional regulator [Dyadobacter sp. BE34]|uniref:DNA-binding PadR family transcriptional regulator n=1 Tax=Dyadobacter fermentans TaxID=94254 RepID=A0ABU1QXU1_9BACT|nr:MULTISPECIES: helix-turn-helix transcriptional regulator [Dyadobacter]MDR6805978.1 DNA-binding PadR family transcriptional regulator [Dyadobacter fermentans]MDR7043718.1 DNA-binding PadR family transcriptional regulator [Dyadobacter sp. BE242]MDR7198030.1 DNA-binding PadR family transcriptional regulator [Dyadobacter sp. BE34]MDR7215992.1 DNA-binding PadR family transcriptional regulator [Dyadobacter sp. BE31]MDR7264482.1 DNA-binding PadR family transcriptional regulator [Dyadobacter sp. BE
MGRSYLGEFEELVLLTVIVLGAGAYGVSIAEELRQRTNRTISLSAVHIALYRLEEKGFVTSEMGGATLSRGGRRKRLFMITTAGRDMLTEIQEIRNQFWYAIVNPAQ